MSNDKIDLNLDTVELEKRTPFAFSLAGRRMVMSDPHLIDWKELVELEKPIMLLRHVLTEEDRDFLKENPIPAEKFNMLMERFFKHYGFDLNQGKADASSIL